MGKIKLRRFSFSQGILMVFTCFSPGGVQVKLKFLLKFWFHCFVKVLFCIRALKLFGFNI